MIQVLCVNISGATDADYRLLYRLASRDRRERADRYLHREDALRCVTAYALLCYATGCSEPSVVCTTEGKPYLPDMPDLYFNLTHSGDFVAIAYGTTPVGIDMEKILLDGVHPGIAQRFFAPAEQQEATTPEGFFRVWSMKESYLKYLGTGLSYPMQSVDVLSPELLPAFYVTELEGYALAVFSPDRDKKVDVLPFSHLISSAVR